MSPPRKYSPELLDLVRAYRAKGIAWNKIAAALGFSASGLKNAMLYRDGATGDYKLDKMPKQLKPWPGGVDFGPDELAVGVE